MEFAESSISVPTKQLPCQPEKNHKEEDIGNKKIVSRTGGNDSTRHFKCSSNKNAYNQVNENMG